jgi:hypothetical protein
MFHRRTPPGSSGGAHLSPRPDPPSTNKEGKFSYWQLANDRLQHFEIPGRDEPDHFERLLRVLHCMPQFTLGTKGSGFWVEVFRNHRTTAQLSFQFLITLNTASDSDMVLVDDLPDLLNMLEHLAPIIQLSVESTRSASMAAERSRLLRGDADTPEPAH